MKQLLVLGGLISFITVSAQVGIGTTNPTAALDIRTTATGIPALSLEAQSAPTGTATGQLAVIGDALFCYDASRGKWLSVESTMLSFGLEGVVGAQELEYSGDVQNSGPLMPFDGTIVYVTVNTNSTGGAPYKEIQLYKNGVAIPNNQTGSLDGRLTLVDDPFACFRSKGYNIDFDAGDFFEVDVEGTGSNLNAVVVNIWIKKRS